MTDAEGNELVDAVIELFGPENAIASNTSSHEIEIDQVDKEFVPGISAISVGTQVRFPNSDDILHHVYSFSPAKTFNTPLYGMADATQPALVFDVPGIIEIGCNIHDWMLAYIYVGESDNMAITNESGVATIENLIPGEYQMKVWHPQLSADESGLLQAISISDGQASEVSLSVELLRDRRIRRSPSANRKRYR